MEPAYPLTNHFIHGSHGIAVCREAPDGQVAPFGNKFPDGLIQIHDFVGCRIHNIRNLTISQFFDL
jgi:hypothetical protein